MPKTYPFTVEVPFESAPEKSPKGTPATKFKARITIKSEEAMLNSAVKYAVWGVQSKARKGAFGWKSGTVVDCDISGTVVLTPEQQWALMSDDEKNRFRAMVMAEMQAKAAVGEMANYQEDEKVDEFSEADVTEQ